ncbi:coiled-coil domain-containing protein 55-domain containing protein [Phaeosphaeria sp. MPI-PUGE-AT-0046c]|nr:coiled-coil domain-containing protein 55-domain containing protein [Phaeosphaeria sp. MPI-PUGE-AT-0046c]
MSMKFGFNLKNKAPAVVAKSGAKSAPKKKKKPLLDDDDEAPAKAPAADDAQEIGEFNYEDTLTTNSESPKVAPPKPKRGEPPAPPTRTSKPKDDDPTLVENSASAREAAQRAEDALAADSTIYDYDAAYDVLHAASALKKAAEEADPLARAPKYMASLFSAAELRKADQQRARDKFLQRERENEGDEFADKEKFVTSAYKTQQEESARLEEEEKKRVAAEEENRRKFGMQGFHKQMLAEREKQHQEAMEAAANAAKAGIAIPISGDDAEMRSEKQQVEELKAQGKEVLLNEDGQVADKRQLLSAGLNIIAKPRAANAANAAPSAVSRPVVNPLAMNAKSGRGAQRERQTQMLAQQIEASAKRKAEEDAAEEAKVARAAKSQKTEVDVMSAKERYLARKAAKEKEKAAK